ncbi:MAG: hypothetical protein F2842_09105 [Actinobacteria bacterium]|uniref:Unannotated protein n=1 Tax=freshwater metagenome TaxID=449393 RepID=A0A6J7KN61_9ZZZZ|nr:hypothetical protein [Actinomycetota bacterium]
MSSPLLTDEVLIFWEGDQAAIEPALADWRAHDVTPIVLGDDAVMAILRKSFPEEYLAIYSRIRIESCRSDLARWLMLYDRGGFFADAHAGPNASSSQLDPYTALLGDHQLVLFEFVPSERHPGRSRLIAGMLMGQRGSPVIREFVDVMFEQLAEHMLAEEVTTEHVPYNIFSMTSGWRMFIHFYDTHDEIRGDVLWPMFEGAVSVNTVMGTPDEPIRLYKHYRYREPGNHWSERQQHERLFSDVEHRPH